jgi:acetolactate synthase-1/2/3 large subunit
MQTYSQLAAEPYPFIRQDLAPLPTCEVLAHDEAKRSRLINLAEHETLADQLVMALVSCGIDTFFGVPGGAIEPLFDALARAQARSEVRVVPMRGEAGAAFAADGYFRETGHMAACLVTTGPGISNLLTATMSAEADRIPLLLLTPQAALHKEGRGALQDSSMDGHDMARVLGTCTRYSSVVSHPEQLSHKLQRALESARRAPAGPVHLSLPSDILRSRPIARWVSPGRHPEPCAFDGEALARLRCAVGDALSPVFYVGDDAGHGAERVFDLARVFGGQVVSSPAGKRWLGHRDPSYRGASGFSGNASAQHAIDQADLVVAFGATFDEFSTNAWSALGDVTLYAVDQHTEFVHRMPQAQPVLASPSVAIRSLLEKASEPAHTTPAPPSGICRRLSAPRPGPVNPSDLMRWLGSALDDDVVVHIDAGSGFSWSTRYLERVLPDTYRVAMGLSTMCWAISAVVGACLGRRRRSVCITGDGAMLMSSLELTVAVDQDLPVTILVLNDSGLGMVRHGQRMAGAESIAHDIAPVRFDLLAQACGAQGVRVPSFADLARLDRRWLCDDTAGPCVIDVCIDREAVPPMADRVSGLAAGRPR